MKDSIITNTQSRRSILKAGGMTLFLPFLESFASAAQLSSAAPKRFVFLGGGYGFTHESFYPTEAGAFANIGLTKGLSPLERHMSDITMVSNLHNPLVTDPHSGSSGYLSGRKSSVSCDQIAAQTVGTDSRYPSLVLTAIGDEGGNSGHGAGSQSLSTSIEGKPITGFRRPIDLYHHLFSGGGQSPKEMEAMLAQKRSMLDIVSHNGASMNSRIAKNDREKLDEYFESIRDIELKLQRQAEWAARPKPKAPFEAPEQGLSGEEEIKLMLEMVVLALQTNSTRVATYRLPTFSLLRSLDVSITPHTMSHYKSSAEKKAASELRDQKLMGLFADFIDRLKSTTDANGENLFESTIVNYGSNLRTGHTLKNCPTILTGGGVGRVRRGSHIILPELTPLSNYWLTLLQEGGVDVNQFSDSTGTLSELVV